MSRFQELVAHWVETSPLSIRKLAEQIGLPKSTIYEWHKNGRSPRHWQDVVQFAQGCGLNAVDTNDLLGAAGYPTLEQLWTDADTSQQTLLNNWAETLIRSNVPPPTPAFVGRESVKTRLAQQLFQHQRLAILHGMGGMGKTTVAKQVAHEWRTRFPDGIFWGAFESIGTDEQLNTVLATFAHLFSWTLTADLNAHKQQVGQLLANKQALVIFDDVTRLADIAWLIDQIPRQCAVLVTTRDENAVLPYRNQSIFLGRMTSEEGSQLLHRHYEAIDPEAAVTAKLVELVDGLPLALELAAATLYKSRFLTVEQYAQQLTDEKKRLLRLDYQAPERGLRATFNLSFHRLSIDEKQLFAALGTFGGQTFSVQAAVDLMAGDPFDITLQLGELQARGLAVHYSVVLQGIEESHLLNRYRLHKLLHLFAREKQTAVSPFYQPLTEGLDPTVHKHLQALLPKLNALQTHESLRSLFVDARIHLWQSLIPQTGSVQDRVNQLITLLYDKQAQTGANGLALFLTVLAESIPIADAAHHKVLALRDRVQTAVSPHPTPDLQRRLTTHYLTLAQSYPQHVPLLTLDWENIHACLTWINAQAVWPLLEAVLHTLTQSDWGVLGFLEKAGLWQTAVALLTTLYTHHPTPNGAIRLGAFEQRLVQRDSAQAHLRAGLEQIDDPEMQAIAYDRLAQVVDDPLTVVKEGLDGLADAPQTWLKGLLTMRLAAIHGDNRNGAGIEAALEAGRPLIPQQALHLQYQYHNTLAGALMRRRELGRSQATLAQAETYAHQMGDRSRVLQAKINQVILMSQQYAYEETFAQLADTLAEAQELNDPDSVVRAWNIEGLTRLLYGDDAGAEAALVQAMAWGQQRELAPPRRGETYSALLNLYRLTQQTEKGWHHLPDALALTLPPPLRFNILTWQAELIRQAGQAEEALALLEPLLSQTQNPSKLGIAYMIQGQVLGDLGRASEATTAYQQAITYLENRDPFDWGWAHLALAQHYHTQNDPQTTAHLQQAKTLFQQTHSQRELALIAQFPS